REDALNNRRETFTYDNLHRLDTYSLDGVLRQDVDYDALGNITGKTGVGSYSYGAAQPHAVSATTAANGAITLYDYDANGNMTQRGATQIDWNSANLPIRIDDGTHELAFHYGPHRNRYKQVADLGGQVITTHYIGGLLEAVSGNGVI